MASIYELKSLIGQLTMLKTLTQTYQQISANHIRKTRTSVVRNRDFITDLLLLFQDVRVAYKDELIDLMKRKKIKSIDSDKLSLIKHNGKSTAVFVAANTGLYGSIINKTVVMLTKFLKENDVEVTIIGKVGEQLFKAYNPDKKYIFFDFPDASIDPTQLRTIVSHLLKYEKVLVFYAQFQSIVSQDPTISALGSSIDMEKEDPIAIKRYLFEPSLEQIVVFFETEIFGLIFEQTLRESQLAKQASRMYAMDQAIQNITKSMQETTMKSSVLHHRMINTKQVNSLAGMSLWT
jgi:ATP synthase F1 gamma subunit